jgi:spore germination protein GerM
MKKIVFIICLIIIFSFVLIGCNGQSSDNANGDDPIDQSSDDLGMAIDYYPILENVEYVYQGYGNEFAFYNVFIDYTSETKMQQRINNGGTEVVQVIEYADDMVSCVYKLQDTFYRENFFTKDSNIQDILLMDPIEVGTTWETSNGGTRTIMATAVNIETPYGEFSTITVVTENDYGITTDYYAKDIGLVKTTFESEGDEISSALSQINQNVPLIQQVSFYYPSIDDSLIYFKNRDIEFFTNDITREVLEAAYKEPVADQPGNVFSANTEINSYYLNQDGMVYLDLSQEFISEMNAGSGYESMILQCVANTFGGYYYNEGVILTIDNDLYVSGHIVLEEGDYLSVNTEDNIEF